MDPRLLTQLATIVELGSVTKAAQKLNITQPTLSRTVKVIEDRVGAAVLRRRRHGVAPTEIGARLAAEGREILRRSQQADAAIEEWKHGFKGELRIGVGPMLATTIMGDFFAETMAKPPSYGQKIYCEYAARLVERLKRDQLDVAIIPYDLNRDDDVLVREKLFQDHLSVFVGQTDPLVGRRAVPARDLAQHQWISVGEISGLFDVTREMLDHLGLHDVVPRIENTGDVTMTFRMLEKTRSCSLLPFRLLGTFQDRFRIAPVDLDVELATRNVGLWTTMAGRDRPETLDFLKRLNAYLARAGLT
ncbi:LysR family transcriptional regulator [Chachezhania sediminis]|uniref:LysR family transcriptional regulator n=1 Tax=Chachezhania sediminis TaxID=2599291 RepID=UPI00131B7111|nr:LysR family transcriptional regulator [Chachezhania sediminis]